MTPGVLWEDEQTDEQAKKNYLCFSFPTKLSDC